MWKTYGNFQSLVYLVGIVIIMKEVSLTDYIRWFSENHVVQDLDSINDGVIITHIGTDFLIRKESVKE